ncbi:glycoside hydrolase family 3 protein [Halegenticoccus soli]|uniref:glycoside hydrolase family 3 protein n=1 Tax=Halegenticoccus soli TaxID=1985678 RepID=UPI0018EBB244|nr:glycoside hydrolase family 3 N-terminal domain-containing protein [Halegenticoccus soli]
MVDNTFQDEGRTGTSRRRFMEATGGIGLSAALSGYLSDEPRREKRPSERVRALVGEMSLQEKIGQMTQVAAYEVDDDPKAFFERYQPGSLMYATTADPLQLAEDINELLDAAIEAQPHDVPFVFGIDAVHGNNNLDGATIFPHNHGVGATWNEEYARRMAEHTSKTLRATGTHWTFSPVADIQRDPRWGRFYEGFSEDPYLASRMVAEKVRGYERTENGYKSAGATVKHFAGYSEPRHGDDRTPALIPYRTFRHTHLPPFHAGISAGAETVMVNSGSVNGVPAHASEELLQTILRDTLGFEGMVVSDWHDFYRMVEVHEYVADVKDAVRLGIDAGIDMYMVPAAGIESDTVDTYQRHLRNLVESGEISMDRIDDAVTNVLAFKEALGLFENPYADPQRASEIVGGARELAYEIATDSMTLLKNDGTLPFDPKVGTVLVTGPSADDVANMMGGWTLGWQGVGETLPPAVTPLDGIKGIVSDSTEVVHEPTGLYTFDNEAAVRKAASDADAVVAVLGEGPYAEEHGDIDTLGLPDAQRELVRTLDSVGTPHAGVLFAGRPRGTRVFDRLPAAVMAYLPGTMGGAAVADVVFGNVSPSGRLPFTWPAGTGQLLNVHNLYPPELFGTGETPPTSTQEPTFPFGHGLSYTEFTYADLRVEPSTLPEASANERINVSVRVTNSGDRSGDHVIPVYAHRRHGAIASPMTEVLGVDRVSLDPGESTRVIVKASVNQLATVPGDVFSKSKLRVLPGDYAISVGEWDEEQTLTVR